MTFHIITLFPEAVKPYLKSSIVGKAEQKGLVKVKYYDLLDFSSNRHKKARPERSRPFNFVQGDPEFHRMGRRVDDRPYGGGPGMVLQIEPILKAVQAARKTIGRQKVKVILFSAGGNQLNNASVSKLAKNYKHLVLVCGRYEGVDERIKKILRDQKLQVEELSVGSYVLTGGELPAMLLVDTVSRQIKGVLGKEESLEEKRLGVGVPAYTRPEVFTYRGKKYRVPRVLTSGDHAEIQKWRKRHRKYKSTK